MYDESVHFDPEAGGWWLVGRTSPWSSVQTFYKGAEGAALGVAQFIKDRGCIQLREIDDILETAGITVDGDGDDFLMGEHVRRPKIVSEYTTLRGPVSAEYCQIIERLFTAYPISLEIGDLASFPDGHEPWYVVWQRHEGQPGAFDLSINLVDAVGALVCQRGAARLMDIDSYLDTLHPHPLPSVGNEVLTSGRLSGQGNVDPTIPLIRGVTREFCEVIEALFATKPVSLELGDPKYFPEGMAAYWVAWAETETSISNWEGRTASLIHNW